MEHMSVVEFVEKYLGIKLSLYQKLILRALEKENNKNDNQRFL